MAQLFGKYELLFRLATGGMAEIFLARQKGIMGFERFVVIKKILPHLAQNKHFVLMFFDEARIAARLNHPNVIQVHELGEHDGEYYITMEYLEGQSLSALLRATFGKKNNLPLDVATSIAIQACEGLHYAHEMVDANGKPANLVHRDLSPQNLFVLYSGVAKVVDFGIAQVEQKLVQTRTGTIKGKYAYMSPEQVSGKTLDRRSDIFAMGVVLWEILTTRRLFKYDNDLAIAMAIAKNQAAPPSSVRSDVPHQFDRIVLKALNKDPDKRYQSAHDLGQALTEASVELGLRTGPPVVSTVMRQVFAETIAKQDEALKGAERGSVDLLTPDALKPDTEESLDFTATGERTVEHPKDEKPTAYSKPPPELTRGRPLRMLAPLFVLLLLGGGAIALWAAGVFDDTGPSDKTGVLDAGMVGKTALDGGSVDAGLAALVPDGSEQPPPPGADTAIPDAGPTKEPADAGLPARTPTNRGRLRIVSQPPGAQIWLDGRLQKRVAPLTVAGIRPGRHVLKAQLKGYQEKRQEARVVVGKTVRAKLKLQAQSKPEVGRPSSENKQPQGQGFLRLDTDPWTNVFLGQRKLGPTPLARVPLPAGKHKLRLVNKGEGIERTITVVISADELTTRTVRF